MNSLDEVYHEGFVEDSRCFGPIVFIILRTLSTFNTIGSKVQFLTKDPLLINQIKNISRESYIKIKGIPETGSKSKIPSYLISSIIKINPSLSITGDSLIKPKSRGHIEFDSVEYRRKEYHEIILANDILKRELRTALQEKNFIEICTPKLISGFTEGGAELFKVESETPLYLSQSPQLHKQAMINIGIEKVFEIGPMYRAEKFKTPRHLNECICWDVQMVTETIENLIDLIKEVITKISIKLNQKFPLVKKINPQSDFKIVSYKEVISKLNLIDGAPLTIEEERKIPSLYNAVYVFITHYPPSHKSFYIKGEKNFDLVCPSGELVSGGIRENDYDKLMEQIKLRNINPENLRWYLDMFKVGTPISGGFGLGIDRLISFMLNLSNIKYSKIFY